MRPIRLLFSATVALGASGLFAPAAFGAVTTTFSETVTIPVPPASNYAGAGGGDGWDVSLSTDRVYNVFHHSSSIFVACHNQSDASACYSPVEVTDASGNRFSSSGHSGTYLDQATGKLYVYGVRNSDATPGVVCFDTTVAPASPYCGFTALGGAGDGLTGTAGTSVPMVVGGKLYAFNYFNSASPTGAQDEMLCFDLSTKAACAGQPFAVNIGAGSVSDGTFPSPATAAIGNLLIVPINVNGHTELACFDAIAQGNCAGAWPVAAPSGGNGSPFPMLDGTGKLIGLCLATGADPCYGLDGSSVATPANMTSAINASAAWNGPAFVLGPRVYVPEWFNFVDCYDYSTNASCATFPKSLNNIGLLYTVNRDPQRPTCIWVNGDYGSAQIQNFDAYTGGPCGQGSIRVLASQFVVGLKKCEPVAYQSLQVLAPAASTYTSSSVEFDDGDGNAIPGIGAKPLDGAGAVDLNGLGLNTATGLPQFLITLNGETGSPGSVVIKLTWTGTYDPDCIQSGTQVAQLPTSTATSLSGGGQSGANITVPAGTPVIDRSTLSGGHAGSAGGTVRYTWYSDSTCSTVVSAGGAQPITAPGSLPDSAPVTLRNPGTYYVVANYSGDGSNFASESRCGDEAVVVHPPAAVQSSAWTLTVGLAGNGRGSVSDRGGAISCRHALSAHAASGSTCSHAYPAGTVVTLTETPTSGSKFEGWRGAPCERARTCHFKLNANTTVTAVFGKVIRTAPLLRVGDTRGGAGHGTETGLVIRPSSPGCATEIVFIADVGCTQATAEVSGRIGEHATGFIVVKVYSWFGMREARGKISHGRWHASLVLPGMNHDPVAPVYLIVVHYGGDGTTHAGTIARWVSIEVER